MASEITVTCYDSPREFIIAVEGPLSATREWQNTIPIGLYTLYNSPTAPLAAPGNDCAGFTLLSTHDSSGLCLALAKSPSYHSLGVWSAVDIGALDLPKHVAAVARELEARGGGWLSFSGDERLVDALSTGLGAGRRLVEEEVLVGSVITKDTISRREERHMPPGHAIKQVAFPDDDNIRRQVAGILKGFHADARDVDLTIEHCEKDVADMVSRGDVWVYTILGEPVSGCYLGVPTKHGKGISSVGTRVEYRGNGYAELLVGEVCRRLLDSGLEYLTIFFKDGSTAGRIYRRVGFGRGSPGKAGELEFMQKNLRLE